MLPVSVTSPLGVTISHGLSTDTKRPQQSTFNPDRADSGKSDILPWLSPSELGRNKWLCLN